MKKMKFSFGEGGFQGFLLQHVEKCVLGVIVLLVGWLILSGSSAPAPLDARITKDALKKSAFDADGNIAAITQDRWEKVIVPKRRPASNPQDEVTKRIFKLDKDSYVIPNFDPELVPEQNPRKDPILIAAENIRVTPLYGPLAIKHEDAIGPANVARRPEEDRVKDPIDRLQVAIRAAGASYGSSYVEEEMPPEEGKPETKKSTTPKKTGDKKKPNPYGSEGPGPGVGPIGPRVENVRTVPPDATQGIRPKDANCRAIPAYAMVITATVPFDKQWRAFEDAFANAPNGQNPKRDLPTYMAVWVKRADVTEDPNIDPAKIKDWTQISNLTPISTFPKNVKQTKLKELEAVYGGIVRERCDESMLDGSILHPVPPFLLTDLREALIHPEIPLASEEEEIPDAAVENAAAPGITPEGPITPDGPDDPTGSALGPDGRMQPGGRGGPGPATGPVAAPGYKSKRTQGINSMDGKFPAVDYADGFDAATFKPPAKKMIRFVDYDVKPGRKYRYKVQLVLRDPNHPRSPVDAPDITSLDDKVRERIKKLEADEAKTKRRVYWVITPDSAASAVVEFPGSEKFPGVEKFLASEAVQPKEISLKEVKVPGGEPSAKVMSVVWEPRISTYVPAEKTVRRATFLAGKVDSEVIHPVQGDVRKLSGYPQTTNALVLDIYGGELLPGVDPRSPVRAPGSTLIMNRDGKLIVTDEVADVDGYHRYSYPEPKADSNSNALDIPGSVGESVLDIPGYAPPKSGRGK